MSKQPSFILLIAALALGAFFVAMWIWQLRMSPHHLAHSAHKALRGTLEMRGISAPEDDDESIESLDGSNEKNTAGLLECDESLATRRMGIQLRVTKFSQLRCLTARVASREASAKRIEFVAADRFDDPVLVGGGIGMFLEHCPPSPPGLSGGCLAVEYSRNGEVSRAVPLRLQAIVEANIVSAYNWKGEDHLHRQVDWPELVVESVSPYPGGDLLVHLGMGVPFPHSTGVARVAQDGQPRWFREDYSLPWPHIIDDNLALVRSRRPQSRAKTLRVNHKKKVMACYESWELHDAINLIDGRGRLLDEIDLLEALLESPYSALFERNLNGRDNPAFTNSIHRGGSGFPQGGGCNNPAFANSIHHCRLAAGTLVGCNSPAFANSIHQLGTDAGGANNITPGDIVASLPFLNAFGIIDQNNRRFKELVRGSFIHQHAVRHLEKARFLMFDLGTSPRRLLMFDLATGKETTLFPRDHTPTHLRQIAPLNFLPNTDYAKRAKFKMGMHLAVSPDRQRILFGKPRSGLAFELRLSDGRVLNIFRQLHDLSSVVGILDPFRQRAVVFQTTAYDYANRF